MFVLSKVISDKIKQTRITQPETRLLFASVIDLFPNSVPKVKLQPDRNSFSNPLVLLYSPQKNKISHRRPVNEEAAWCFHLLLIEDDGRKQIVADGRRANNNSNNKQTNDSL